MKKLYLLIAFWILNSLVFGQSFTQYPKKEWSLNTGFTQGGRSHYVARDAIFLKNGFGIKARSDKSAVFNINPNLILPKNAANGNDYAAASDYSNTNYSINTENPYVGFTPGQGSITPQGAAVYSVPIQIPAGINGMQPQLSVNYNSLSGDGILGHKWELGGISAISRMPRDRWRDGDNKQISFTNSDRFALDGNTLVLLSGSNGQSGATYATENETFADITCNASGTTEPTHFIIKTRDGKVLEYGNTIDSKLKLNVLEGSQSPTFMWMLNKVTDLYGNTIVYSYHENQAQPVIREIAYTGNGTSQAPYTIQFSYDEKSMGKSSIYYPIGTGYGEIKDHLLLSNIKVISGGAELRKYDFVYSFEDITQLRFIEESILGKTKVNKTQVFWDKNTPDDNFRSFAIGIPPLELSTGDFDGDGKQEFVSLRYKWHYNDEGLPASMKRQSVSFLRLGEISTLNLPVIATRTWESIMKSLDSDIETTLGIDGLWDYDDSDEDIEDINGGSDHIRFAYLGNTILDTDGDGKDEIIVKFQVLDITDDGTTGDYGILLTGFMKLKLNGNAINAELITYRRGGSRSGDTANLIWLDHDGDGVFSWIFTGRGVSSGILIAGGYKNASHDGKTVIFNASADLNLGFDGRSYVNATQNNSTFSFFNFAITSKSLLYITDLNGNGKSELFCMHDGNWESKGAARPYDVYEFNNGAWSSIIANGPTRNGWEFDANHFLYFGDFNADGKQDILKLFQGVWKLYHSTGNGLTPATTLSIPFLDGDNPDTKIPSGDYPLRRSYAVLDFNADGRADIVEVESGTVNNGYRGINTTFFTNLESGWTQEAFLKRTRNDNIQDSKDEEIFTKFSFADLNGDGKLEYIFYPTYKFSDAGKYNSIAEIIDLSTASSSYNSSSPLARSTKNFVSKVVNGIGTEDKFFYDLATSVVQTNYTYPTGFRKFIPNGLWLSTNHQNVYTTKNSPNNTPYHVIVNEATYSNPVLQQGLKGYLGFKDFKMTSTVAFGSEIKKTELESSSTINTDLTALLPSYTKAYVYDGATSTLISQTSSTFDYDNLSSGANKHFVLKGQTVTVENPINKTKTVNTTTYTRSYAGQKPHLYDVISTKVEKFEGEPATTTIHTATQDFTTFTDYTTDNGGKLRVPLNISTKAKYKTESDFTTTQRFSYANNGKLDFIIDNESKTNANGDNLSLKTEFLARNTYGTPTEVKVTGFGGYDAAGTAINQSRTTSKTFDATGRYVLSKTDAAGKTSYFTYDQDKGFLLSSKDVKGLTTTYEYNTWGALIKKTEPDGTITTTNTDWLSAIPTSKAVYVTETEQSGSGKSRTYFDALNREVKSESEVFGDFAGNVLNTKWLVVDKSYSVHGSIAKVSHPYYSTGSPVYTTYDYDYLGRVEIMTDRGQETLYSYSGLSTSVSLPDGTSETATMDAAGKQTSSQKGSAGTVNYTYASNGQVLTSTAQDKVVSFTYDAVGNRASMSDPSSGTITYRHNAFGEPIYQKDANESVTTTLFDALGRVTEKKITPKDGTTLTYNYTFYTSNAATHSLEQVLVKEGTVEKHKQTFTYDNLSRPLTKTDLINANKSFICSYTYDAYSRLSTKTFPNNVKISYEYSPIGDLVKIYKAGSSPQLLWQMLTENQYGQALTYKYGNNQVITQAFDPIYNLLTEVSSTGNYAFGYKTLFDEKNGNLKEREFKRASITYNQVNYTNIWLKEVFGYDTYERLTKVTPSAPGMPSDYPLNGAFDAVYNNLGNFTSRTGMNDIAYNVSDKPYQLQKITDPNGTAIYPTIQQNITYSPFNKVNTVSEGNVAASFLYGVDMQRVRMEYTVGTATKTTYYLPDYEKEEGNLGTNYERVYVAAPTGLAAIIINGTNYYVHTDHLGSIMALTDQSSNLVAEYSYDAWGRRRDPNTYLPYTNTAVLPAGDLLTRGYTGHEHLQGLGLINMNGRIYDPKIGRFLQADPYIYPADNAQAYNGYAYAFNNPLKYTDPSGEIVPIVAAIIIGAAVSATANVVQQGFASNWTFRNFNWGSFATSVIIGAATGAASFGIGGAFGGIGGGASTTIGKIGMEAARAFAHGTSAAVFGGIGASMSGNGAGYNPLVAFATGAIASGAGSVFGHYGGSFAQTMGGQMALGAVVGGGVNVALGGNFWEGAVIGAITAGLNHGLHGALEKDNLVIFGDAEQASDVMIGMSKMYKKEVAGYLTEKGVIVNFDFKNNTLNKSFLPKYVYKNGKYYTNYNGESLEIKGIVHTHPRNTLKLSIADYNTSQLLGVKNFVITPRGLGIYGQKSKLPFIKQDNSGLIPMPFNPYDF
jgi:RHS repeat-associated protein